jgi:hypothetical protein
MHQIHSIGCHLGLALICDVNYIDLEKHHPFSAFKSFLGGICRIRYRRETGLQPEVVIGSCGRPSWQDGSHIYRGSAAEWLIRLFIVSGSDVMSFLMN